MDYITVYVTDANNNELEVLCGITEHGQGKWTFWSDTGDEFEEIRQPKFSVEEIIDYEGNVIRMLSAEKMDVVYEKFVEQYWAYFVEGKYSF